MEIKLVPAKKSQKEILRNLLEKYGYEFSQYDQMELDELGLYGYDYLDYYWIEKNHFPYLIEVDGRLAGFALVNPVPLYGVETDFTLAEFFVAYSYRELGVGSWCVQQLFDTHQGRWGLMFHPRNKGSQKFWLRVVGRLANNGYQRITENREAEYNDGTIGHLLLFETGDSNKDFRDLL